MGIISRAIKVASGTINFLASSKAKSSEVNEDLNTIYTLVNGHIDGNNIDEIATSGKVSGISFKNLASIPSSAGNIPAANLSAGLIEAVYPVGSIYINASVSTNPATLLGFGTWVTFGAGRVLVGIDTTQTEFDVLGETGGAKTHTLSTAEMPAHTHTEVKNQQGGGLPGRNIDGDLNSIQTNTGSTGGGLAHNNLQPYIVVYMWRRTF